MRNSNKKHSDSAIWTIFIWIVEDYSRNISVKKHINIYSETAKIANLHFSHFKSTGTISCHSNQSSYPIGTKNTIIRNLVRICFMSSGDVIWKCWQTTTEGWWMPAYTISSLMSLRLRRAKKSGVLAFQKVSKTGNIEKKKGMQKEKGAWIPLYSLHCP